VFANFTHRNSLPLVPLSICIIGFFHQFVYRPMSDEQLPPKLIGLLFLCLRLCHQVLHAITIYGLVAIALGWFAYSDL
jgi:hypothetical protein